jgi:hypothetical protein
MMRLVMMHSLQPLSIGLGELSAAGLHLGHSLENPESA